MNEAVMMLPQIEAELCERDAALPGLPLVLSPEAIEDAICAAVPGLRFDELAIDYARYKPGMNCLSRIRAVVDGLPVTGYAKAYAGDAGVKLEKSRQRDDLRRRPPAGRLMLWEHGTEIAFQPNDNKLVGLADLLCGDRRQRLLERLFHGRYAGGATSVRELNYKPERRFVALVNASGFKSVVRLYSKREFAIARSKKVPEIGDPHLTLPKRIGRSRRRGALAMSWVEGSPLIDILPAGDHLDGVLDDLAGGLARFHSVESGGLFVHDPNNVAARLDASAAMIGWLRPDLGSFATDVAMRLAADVSALPVGNNLIHGDLHPKQMLIRSDGIGMIDLDECGRGDPAADFGLFLAHLERNRYWLGWPEDFPDAVEERLLAEYGRHGGSIDRDRVLLYKAAGLYGLLVHHFRRRDPDWSDLIAQGLERVCLLHRRLSRPERFVAR